MKVFAIYHEKLLGQIYSAALIITPTDRSLALYPLIDHPKVNLIHLPQVYPCNTGEINIKIVIINIHLPLPVIYYITLLAINMHWGESHLIGQNE